MKSIKYFILLFSLSMLFSSSVVAQGVMIGPRITGNFNIYNQKGLTGSWNGIGIGVGPTIDAYFGNHMGMMVNLTLFDMRGFSNSVTANNVITDNSYSLSYLVLDPMFQMQFSGFYMTAGPSVGIKLSSSGEITQTQAGQAPIIVQQDLETKTITFNIVAGTGYTFALSPALGLGTDLMVYIPLSDTYNFPGLSNDILTLKLGASLKFRL